MAEPYASGRGALCAVRVAGGVSPGMRALLLAPRALAHTPWVPTHCDDVLFNRSGSCRPCQLLPSRQRTRKKLLLRGLGRCFFSDLDHLVKLLPGPPEAAAQPRPGRLARPPLRARLVRGWERHGGCEGSW